jgi:hypothetical protein
MKKKRFCTSILPDKDIMAHVFWRVVSATPVSPTFFAILILIEEIE